MAFNGEKIAFVGVGVMGEAMIKGLLSQELLPAENIVAAYCAARRIAEMTGLSATCFARFYGQASLGKPASQ